MQTREKCRVHIDILTLRGYKWCMHNLQMKEMRMKKYIPAIIGFIFGVHLALVATIMDGEGFDGKSYLMIWFLGFAFALFAHITKDILED